EQYDSTVQASTVIGPGGDAGVILVRGADFGIAVTVDCNSRYVLLDPYEGGKAVVAEAARNVGCTGARPLGITDCLNFGSPGRLAAVGGLVRLHRRRAAARGSRGRAPAGRLPGRRGGARAVPLRARLLAGRPGRRARRGGDRRPVRRDGLRPGDRSHRLRLGT